MGKHSAPEPDLFSWLDRDDGRRSPTGNCWTFEDVMDGFVVHTEGCSRVGKSWISGSGCIDLRRWRGLFPDWARHA